MSKIKIGYKDKVYEYELKAIWVDTDTHEKLKQKSKDDGVSLKTFVKDLTDKL